MLCFFSRITVGTWHNKVVKAVSVGCVLSYVVVFLTVCQPIERDPSVPHKADARHIRSRLAASQRIRTGSTLDLRSLDE